ncbi:MAG TPA: NifB/NifX family molybdenum-iron cluster-binding protein [Dehalococcoidia bacterium]|nr:NifB/NifX family molybdenum-iron cluster-binding protein [Dehalococcoidia bacterium]
MKIAVSATGPGLDAEVDPRFGRCQYLIAADTDTMEFEATENTNIMAGGGAGISTAQTVANMGVQVVLTGNCGPNAYQTLSAAGIQVITGVSGTVRQAIEGYKEGRFQALSAPSVDAHFGMGGGMGGSGRGMGMGGGGGRGMGMGMGMAPAEPIPQPQSPEQEMEILKGQTEMLNQQLEAIQQRIAELDKKGS